MERKQNREKKFNRGCKWKGIILGKSQKMVDFYGKSKSDVAGFEEV